MTCIFGQKVYHYDIRKNTKWNICIKLFVVKWSSDEHMRFSKEDHTTFNYLGVCLSKKILIISYSFLVEHICENVYPYSSKANLVFIKVLIIIVFLK